MRAGWIGFTWSRLTILSLRLSLPAKCTTRDYHPTIITTLDYSTVTQTYASTLSELLCATQEGVIGHKFLKQGLAGSEGRVPLFRGTGVHFPRDGRSFSQGRVPLIRQRTHLFRGTATHLSEGRLPYSERRVPHYRGSGTPFSSDGHQLVGPVHIFRRTCSPYPRDGYPLTEGLETVFRWSGTQLPPDGHPFSEGRGGPFADGRD